MENIKLLISNVNDELSTNAQKAIQNAEGFYHGEINDVVNHLLINPSLKFILIAGPSSAGKTTSSKLIKRAFKEKGIGCKILSLDDFFVNKEDTPRLPNNMYDYENVNAIDWSLFDKCMNELLKNKKSKLPTYNFLTGVKEYSGEFTTLNENEIIIIEGLHALNPIINNFIPSKLCSRVYLNTMTKFYDNSGNIVVDNGNLRLIRRLIRDVHTRGASIQSTFETWQNVCDGELKYITPFKDTANFTINTTHYYELGIYKKIIKDWDLGESSLGKLVKSMVELFVEIEKTLVPENSLLKEFVH